MCVVTKTKKIKYLKKKKVREKSKVAFTAAMIWNAATHMKI